MNEIPLLLGEALVSFYPASSSGSALLDSAIWAGAYAQNLRIGKVFNTVQWWPSGASNPRHHHEGVRYAIDIGRLWFLRLRDLADFDPQPNQKFVMVIAWVDPRTDHWHRRTYSGVMCDSWDATMIDMTNSALDQKFIAETETRESGTGIYTSLSAGSYAGEVLLESYPFFYDGPLMVGDNLLGHYSFTAPVELNSVLAACFSPVGDATILTMTLDDAETDQVVTIAAGEDGLVQSASASYAYRINSGQVIRWKATSGPALAENCATGLSMNMRIKLI